MSELPRTIPLKEKPSINIDFNVHFFDRQQTSALDFAIGDYSRSVQVGNGEVIVRIQEGARESEYAAFSVRHETPAIDYLSIESEKQKCVELMRTKLAEQGLKYTSEKGFFGIHDSNMQYGL
jgi:hypothetical protein